MGRGFAGEAAPDNNGRSGRGVGAVRIMRQAGRYKTYADRLERQSLIVERNNYNGRIISNTACTAPGE